MPLACWLRVAAVACLIQQVQPLLAAPEDRAVARIIESRCVSCHGPAAQNAGVRLDSLSKDLVNDRRAAETWHDVREALHRGAMPPLGAPSLSSSDRETLLSWLEESLREADEARRPSRGVVVMRRLNRVEYQNTMRDLLGLDIDYVRHLPPDELSPDGFANNGAALRMSALQIEHYLDTARDGLRRAVVEGPEPPAFEYRARETVADKLKNVHWSNRLGRTGTFVARVPEFPDEGPFVLKVRARAEIPDGAPYPRMHVALGYRADTQTPARTVAEVDVPEGPSREFEFRGRIEEYPIQSRTQSKYPGLLVWIRNAYSDGNPPPAGETVEFEEDGAIKKRTVWPADPTFPAILVESLEFRAPDHARWPPEHHARIVPDGPLDAARESDSVAGIARRFLRRAYRRPAREDEVAGLAQYFAGIRPRFGSFEQALRETLAMALISPDFLYRIERGRPGSDRLSDHELASRLSYFLWSTMPDERLMDLADRGRLRKPGALRAEALRMLDDPKSRAFVEQFSDQWLDLGGVRRVAINPNYYPDFDLSLKEDMRRETHHYFAELLRSDASALQFLRSDFAMLNERLARHYGIEGPRGGTFERVALPAGSRPGGLLAHASVLLANSTGEDSHPVKRGVWIRRALLGDPPASPPASVPNLDSAAAGAALLPLKRQLELHQDSESCAHCHRGIDPWGVALEDFDALGLRRETVRRRAGEREERHPVDAVAILPGGREVRGAADLADYLFESRGRQFARALAEKLLAYALGRSLEPGDRDAAGRIATQFEKGGCRLRDLCTIIVTSELFRRR